MKRFVLALLLSGCGALDQTGHCDFRPKENRCQERTGLPTTLTAFEQTCKALPNSAYADGPCPHAGSLGGCDVSEVGNTVHDWYYADPDSGFTAASNVMTECAGKSYLSP